MKFVTWARTNEGAHSRVAVYVDNVVDMIGTACGILTKLDSSVSVSVSILIGVHSTILSIVTHITDAVWWCSR